MASLLYVCGLGMIFLAAAFWLLQEAHVVVDMSILPILAGLGALSIAGALVTLWHRARS